ncbi:MAG: hypothetical protein RBU37_02335 [Myxococcota bacterium]|jgi:flagellar motor protein MotB|nr:hypothetical protein [Myxococcota bacterium]
MRKQIVVLALCCASCSQALLSPEDASRILVEQLSGEDAAVLATCRALSEQQGLSPQTGRLLEAEAERSLDAFLAVLGVQPTLCPARALLDGQPSTDCLADLAKMRDAFSAMEDCTIQAGSGKQACDSLLKDELQRDRFKLLQSLDRAGLGIESLWEQPRALLTAIDLSPAVVAGVIYFADQSAKYSESMVSSLGFAAGLAQLVIEQLAAEFVAMSIEEVLIELERRGVVSRTGVARSACALYASASARPTVSVRLMKRLILRFELAQARSPYLMSSLCKELDDGEVCDDIVDEVGLKERFPDTWLFDDPNKYDAIQPQLPPHQEEAAVEAQSQEQTQTWRSAVALCEDCAIDELAALAGLMQARSSADGGPAGLEAQLALAQRVEQDATGIEQMRQEVQSLRVELGTVQARLDASLAASKLEAQRAEGFRRDVLTLLMGMSQCKTAMERARQARLSFARESLGVEGVDCESSLDESLVSQLYPQLRVSARVLCEPTLPFELELQTEGFFPRCRAEIEDGHEPQLEEIAAVLKVLGAAEVLLMGHSDQRPITTGACQKRFGDNTALSAARAQSFAEALDALLGAGHGVQLQSVGLGSVAPKVDCAADAGEACHIQNRRVTLRISGARGLDYDLSCATR